MKTDEIDTVVEVCGVAWKGGHNIAVVVKDCGLSKLESALTSAWYLKRYAGKIKTTKKHFTTKVENILCTSKEFTFTMSVNRIKSVSFTSLLAVVNDHTSI